ncbi:hypothetical protein OsccyDRAFT_1155 [Leptolyngbyaceae cyanobacterium JSC-12]|nr:hypothetical protein OsccyDRAFT_1155 [Leptolyngbyaceae cyanobacterium JSC-12]
MRDNRLIRLIQSANVFIFFGVGLLLLSVLGYITYQIYQSSFRERTISGVVNTENTHQTQQAKVSLGAFTPIEGTPYHFAPISAKQNYRQDYYDKAALSTRNYLILDTKDRSAVRLVPNNDALFLSIEKLGHSAQSGKLEKTEGLWYQVVKADTNGDKRLTETDLKTIAVSEVSGKSYKELISQVEQVLGSSQPSPNTLLVIYRTNARHFVSEIDLLAQKVVATQELPSIE